MKFTLALCLVAAAVAVDTEAPVISLDLHGHGVAQRKISTGKTFHSVVCQAKKATVSSCPEPVAKAWDHHDGDITSSIKKCALLVNLDNKPATSTPCLTTVNRNLRSEWVLTYDVKDRAGNSAERVSFSMIFNDIVAPTATNKPSSKNFEYATATVRVPLTYTVTDNYDSGLTAKSIIAVDGKRFAKGSRTSYSLNVFDLKRHTFTVSSHDFAGMFGKNGANNAISFSFYYHAKDTTCPAITVTRGSSTHECGVAYRNPGATSMDIHDGRTAVVNTGSVNGMKVGSYTLTYTATDKQRNSCKKTRTVAVRDTTPPTLLITTAGHATIRRYNKNGNGLRHSGAGAARFNGNVWDSHIIQHSAGYLKDLAIVNNLRKLGTGMKCTDRCAGNSISTSWSKAFNNLKPGTYVLKYVCTDNARNTATKYRTIINEDKTKPIIRILGKDLMTLEATHNGNYVDDGATCSDQVDGMISQNVEVSGDVVNLGKRNKYVISYNCKDSAGNKADTAMRVVYVVQTTCPTCKLAGASKLSREASFPYVDAGAKCTDLIDGNVATITRNTVNVERTGTYYVTYRAKNTIGLWNDGAKCRYGAKKYTRTVVVIDTLKPVISLTYNGKKVTSGNHVDTGVNAQANPFKLMAETATTSSVNGWVVGAAASAVTGLALLGYSMRKTSVATSVPV